MKNRELRERLEALELAEQSAGIGIWDIDLTTGIARGTPQFFRIMGLEPVERMPMDAIRVLRHPEDRERVLAGCRHALESGSDAYEMEYRIVRPDGQVRWISGRGRVVRDAAGKPVRYSCVDLDITERKAAQAALAASEERLQAETKRRAEVEARLRQAQKMEAVGPLTRGIAHDFNNLLQVIMGNLELMKHRREPVIETIEAALHATHAAAQLTHRLLASSRLQPLEPSALEVNQLIAGLSDRMARTLGETIRIETELAADLWPTLADRDQLETALFNLVVNARDAMPEGGRLAIRTRNLALPAPLDDAPAGDYVLIEVTDNGCGVAQEHLSMVYGFVKQSGGHVRLHSKAGQGTSVRLYLPRSSEKAAPSVARARNGETILLVEDNAEVRRYSARALKGLGYEVLEAADGAAALRLLDRQARRVDLLFSDMALPGGMSGRTLADAALSRRPGLAVLFGKPYNLERLAASVREAIDGARA